MTTKKKLSIERNKPFPIPPLSVVRLVSPHGERRYWKKYKGHVFRVGYYSRMDGLDCIWLVNDEGTYEQATDHEFLYRYFDVIQFADHTNWYGRRRQKIPPIRPANRRKRRPQKVRSS